MKTENTSFTNFFQGGRLNPFARVAFCTTLLLVFAAPARAVEAQVLQGHVPAAVSRSQPVERLAGGRRLNLAIGLPLRNQAGLTTLLQQLSDPVNPKYRQWLTPEQFTESFGPTEANYQAVADWARANGLTVTTRYPNRLVLDVAGVVADIENALHVQLQVYQHPSEARKFFAPNSAPSLDLNVPVASISGLDDYSLPRPMLRVNSLDQTANAVPRSGSGLRGSYAAGDFRAAYVPGTLLTGAGQSVGLLQFDGYYASDVDAYRTQFGLPNIPLVNVPVRGGVIIPGANNVEVCLDIEMVMSMAPGVTAIYVFEAPNPSPWVDLLNAMVTNTAISQFSCSWGGGGPSTTAEDIFQQMAAQGQSFFTASGDSDAYCDWIDFPAESPNITQVGGTTLTTTGAGGGYVSETVWNWGLHKGDYVGTGGGISPTYAIPSWQQGISMDANHGSTTMRNIPDVALTADNVYVTHSNGKSGIFGGTSCAAPLWAGFTALVNQHAVDSSLPTIGFMNPPVYNIGKGALYSSTFHDTTTGNNTNSACGPTMFPAVPGYDLTTGWGTPTTALIKALVELFEPLRISPATGFSSSGGVGGPFTVSSINLTVTNSGTNSLTWSLANTSVWLNVSSGGGTLAPGGPSATVTVSLNSGASNLALGTYRATVWFTNLNDNLSLGREFDLAVISPPTIVVQPTNQTVLDGTIATFTVGVNGEALSYKWQANSNNLTDGGHIFGSATNTLSISNVAPANAASYRVIVTNAAGTAVSSNALLVALPGAVDHFAWGDVPSPQVFGRPFAANLTALDRANVISTNFNGSLNLTAWASSAGNQSIEDFESGVWLHAPWVLAPGGGTVIGTLSTNYAHDGFYGLSDPAWTYRTDVQVGTAGDVLSWWIRPGSSSSGRAYLGFAASSTGCWSVVAAPDTSQLIIELNDGFADDQGMAVASQTWQAAKWYKVAVQFSWGSGITCNLYDEDGATLLNTLTYSGVTDLPGGVAMKSFGQFSLDTLQTGTGPMPVPITPAVATNFVSGLWSGTITALQVGTNVLLNARDGAGHLGVSNPFSVIFSNQPPLLTAQPTNQSVPSGYDVTFTLGADGSQPLSYMWLLSETPILGATNASFTTNNVPVSASGSQFSCSVSNAYGTTNSQVVTLTVLALPPTIMQQPVNLTVTEGRGATFSVTGTGSLPLSYYWLLNGTPILGATNASFTTNIVPLSASGSQFSCLVINGYGTVLSSNAILTVVVAPPDCFTELFGTVTTNLANKTFTFTPNRSANFYTVCSLPNFAFPTDPAGGTALILTDDGYSPIALSGGKTVAIYTNQSSVIYVGSNGYLTMNAGDASLWPSYTSHFSLPRVSALYCDLNPNAGGTVSWKQLDDRAAVTYQAVPVFRSNTRTNSFQVELFFDGRIRITYLSLNTPIGLVGLSAGLGQPTNFVASDFTGYPSCDLQPPLISSQPTDQTVPPGSSATFTVGAWGSPLLTYSWRLNGMPIPGATKASYTTNNVPLSASGSQFSCLVSNSYGAVLTSNAMLTVVVLPMDWFTELFTALPHQPGTTNPPSVLAYKTFTFTPDGSPNFYTVCSLPTLTFPTDPTGGTPLSLTDNSYSPIALSGGKTVVIYTNRSSVVYVGSNGYLTMNSGDRTNYPSYANHFSLPRVSALFCYLEPVIGGTVSWRQLDDRAAVTYKAVPTFWGNSPTNSFQVELFFDGRIRITYLSIKYAGTAVVGLSAGAGQPANFVASDFTAYHSCGPQPPSIFVQPTNQTVLSGASATFTVGAWGSPAPSYSWLLNGAPIPGATNASFTTNNVPVSADGSQFSCLVSNVAGTVLSSNAVLTVRASGFTVLAAGDLVVTLDNPSARIYSVLFLSNEVYRVTTDHYISNWGLQTSTNGATFVRNENRYGTTGQPMALHSATATSAFYTGVYSADGANVALERNYNLVPGADLLLTIQTFTNNGASNITLRCFDTFNPDWPSSPGSYHGAMYAQRYTIITNGTSIYMGRGIMDIASGYPVVILGTADSAAVLAACMSSYSSIASSANLNTFFAANGADSGGQSVDLTLDIGRELVLSPAASASFVFYQSISTNVPQAEWAIIQAISAGCPAITAPPTNQTVPVGATAIFSVGATPKSSLGYFWQRNGTNIAGATGSSYTKKNVQLSDSGSQFSCLVSNACGTTNSPAATLTVFVPTSDYFTELFGTAITNLAFKTFTFTPDGSANFYSVCSRAALAFPTDPTGGTTLSLGDDDSSQVTLSGASTVAIYTNRRNVIYVGSNGYLTMNAGDTNYTPSYASHFSLPRVSALYRDLDPSSGGTVSWKQLSDRIAVNYQAVPVAASSTQTNTFQVELFFDGRIRITYLGMNTPAGLVGLSAGTGQPANFVPSDFTAYAPCAFPPPPLLSVTWTNSTLSIAWSAIAGGVYQVQYTSNLLQTNWSNLGGTLSKANGILSLSDVMTNSQRFYRVVVLP